jgi:hypothetical protein
MLSVMRAWEAEQMDTFTISENTHKLRRFFRAFLCAERYKHLDEHHSIAFFHANEYIKIPAEARFKKWIHEAHVPIHLFSISSRRDYALKLSDQVRSLSNDFSSNLAVKL